MSPLTMDRPVPTFDQLPPGGERLLTEVEAAKMLGLQPATLRRWRSTGEPKQPDYVRIGRAVRYRASECHSWIGGLPTSGGIR